MTTNNQRIDGYLGHEKQAQWLKMLGKAIGLGAKEGKGALSSEALARVRGMPTPGQAAMAQQEHALKMESAGFGKTVADEIKARAQRHSVGEGRWRLGLEADAGGMSRQELAKSKSLAKPQDIQ